jgi:hypothetical protein
LAVDGSEPSISSRVDGLPIVFRTNNEGTVAERLRIASFGTVINGTSVLLASINRGNLTINGTDSILNLSVSNTLGGYLYHGGTDMYLVNSKTGALISFTNNIERMRITSGGNVLIGTSSDNGNKVQIDGGMRTTGGITSAIQMFVENGSLYVSSGAGSTYAARISVGYNYPYVDTFFDSYGGPSYEGRIQFRTSINNGLITTRLTIMNSGNVGINNTSPTEGLVVATGALRVTSQALDFTAGTRGISIDTTGGGLGRIYTVTGTGTATDLALGADNTERLRITTGGALLINSSVYIRSKTLTGTANGTNTIFNIFLGYPGGIAGTVEVFAMAGIIGGGSISSRVLTFNFAGGNIAGGSGANANVSNSVLGTAASGFSGGTNIDSLSASITSLTVDSFNISISNTISGSQVTNPTYYIRVTYGLHANATLS